MILGECGSVAGMCDVSMADKFIYVWVVKLNARF